MVIQSKKRLTNRSRQRRNKFLIIGGMVAATVIGSVVMLGYFKGWLKQTFVDAGLAIEDGIRNTPLAVWGALLGLIVLLAVYEALRRWSLSRIPRVAQDICPHCNGALHRVHRTTLDRLITVVLRGHLGRYRCSDCKRRNLYRRRHHHHNQ